MSEDQSYVDTGVEGLDELFMHGIPEKSVNLLVGNPGSGKSIMGLQTLKHASDNGHSCLYMSMEESVEQLTSHMQDFGWEDAVAEGHVQIDEYDPFEVANAVEEWFEKQKNPSVIDPMDDDELPQVFKELRDLEPDRVVVDSLSAVEAGFVDRDRQYRMYVNNFFRFFKEIGTEAFIIVESQEIPDRITENGQAEFLADGIILMHRQKRSRGIEVYKMRGSGFKEKIAPMEIKDNEGIVVRPDDSFFEQQDPQNNFL